MKLYNTLTRNTEDFTALHPHKVGMYACAGIHPTRSKRSIGLEISSSAFPKYDRNLNTVAVLGVTTEMVVAEQRIYHDAEHPSAVVLPGIPRD